jgi:tetratricopeptide repeat protein
MTQMKPHVFVVMPFGIKEVQPATQASQNEPAKPNINADFDKIYDLLIKPALTKAECVPFRADKEPGAGDIRTDMYFELVTADVILADISILNPNVFYELGVRHGVRPRGVLMIHGGWAKRPFDVAPDRTFDYNGKLFVEAALSESDSEKRLSAEVDRLATVLKAALDVDNQTIGSPVYKEMVGLKEVDWSKIKTARAKYFGEVFVNLSAQLEIAKLNGWPGDILTLADDAPTRYHRAKLLWEGANALSSMHRFDAAQTVLEDLLLLEPEHRGALTQYGLVLSRLGKTNEAKVRMTAVAQQYQGDPEAQGILGRVYKDLWRLEWVHIENLEERQREAVATSNYIANAIRSYDLATRRHFDYYNGINVVSFVSLLEHLKLATGEEPADARVNQLPDLISVVRFAAQNALDLAALDSQDYVWAAATLGELDLVAGDGRKARKLYRDAANAPATTYFNVNSMLDQINLFDCLGFRPDAVAAVKGVLDQRRLVLEEKIGGLKKSQPRFSKVVIASGHMIDKPDRIAKGLGERFPPGKEQAVRDGIARELDKWGIGAGHLAICGGARGADILFGELCVERGAEVWLFLPLPEGEFLEESVRLPDTDWETRFFALRDGDKVKTFRQFERLRSPGKGSSVFSRNNLWIINTARVEANDPKNLHAVLVWDETSTGDGPGGTSDFASRVKNVEGRLAVINPKRV